MLFLRALIRSEPPIILSRIWSLVTESFSNDNYYCPQRVWLHTHTHSCIHIFVSTKTKYYNKTELSENTIYTRKLFNYQIYWERPWHCHTKVSTPLDREQRSVKSRIFLFWSYNVTWSYDFSKGKRTSSNSPWYQRCHEGKKNIYHGTQTTLGLQNYHLY